jgi:two-component system sensor histidine kinase HydH
MAGPLLPGPPRRDPPLLVVEFTPHVATALHGTLTRAAFVGAFAVLVLLGSAAMIVKYIHTAARTASQAEAQRRLLALGEMSAVMAHELRNPLASLKGHAQLLSEDLEETNEVTGASRDRVARVIAEATRMERLTAALLAFVRDAPLDCAEVTIAALFAAATERLSPAERGQIVLAPEAASVRLVVDGARVACALGNLLENAVLAAHASVEVTIVSEADGLVIEVCDDGPGLPVTASRDAAPRKFAGPGDHEALFEPFFTTRTRGTGLGLAIARRIAHQHGGTLTAENRSGIPGARFRLSLPRRNG